MTIAARETEVRAFPMLIGGERRTSRTGATIDSIDPFTGRHWARVPDATTAEVDAAVAAARSALTGPWGQMSATARGKALRRLAAAIERHAERLALLEVQDNGKLLREMRAQVAGLPDYFDFFAGASDKLHGSTIAADKTNYFIYTRPEPLGVVAAITSWNSPLLLLTFKVAPALAAGCTVVVKPSEYASVSTLAFADIVEEADLPPGVVNVVTGAGPTVGAALAGHRGIDKVTFTGSTPTGARILAAAGANITEAAVELGGKSPNIVFDDASDEALDGITAGIFAAGGQTCVAGSRVLVQRSAVDAFQQALVDRARRLVLGDPLADSTEMGPLAFADHRARVESYIQVAREEGATIACGGARPAGLSLEDGYFIEPTVIVDGTNAMRHAREEIFGPVVTVLPFEDEADAIRIANDSDFGLAAGVWTNDLRRAHRVAHALDAGTVWLNCYRAMSFTTPFGGFKSSGIGKENGVDAVQSFTRTKAVWVELEGQRRDPFTVG